MKAFSMLIFQTYALHIYNYTTTMIPRESIQQLTVTM